MIERLLDKLPRRKIRQARRARRRYNRSYKRAAKGLAMLLATTPVIALADDAEQMPSPSKYAVQADREYLFGRPNENTGLTSEQCGTTLASGWQAPMYTPDDIATLRSFTLINPPMLLTGNPYESAEQVPTSEGYCGVLFDSENPNAYRLVDYQTEQEALLRGATITHRGECGACSSLQDLAVYIENVDLTEPARECGMRGLRLTGAEEAVTECFQEIGFTDACAQVWYFNTLNTRESCLSVCIANISAPNNNPDGSLNECIRCDENESGPIFKEYAGRTRRGSGLPSAICRSGDEVYSLEHNYPEIQVISTR